MKRVVLVSLIGLLGACGSPTGTKTIEVGDYRFDFPADYELVEEAGIDSYVGRIENDSMVFYFDFGYYSNSFQPTPQEYLHEGYWQRETGYWGARAKREPNTIMQRMDVLAIGPATTQDSSLEKGCEYVAHCRDVKGEFDFPIRIPQEIKRLNFEVDTVDGIYRKIVYDPNPQTGLTGIYLKDLRSFNASMNAYTALSLSTGKITARQQQIALQIFRTGRHSGKMSD